VAMRSTRMRRSAGLTWRTSAACGGQAGTGRGQRKGERYVSVAALY